MMGTGLSNFYEGKDKLEEYDALRESGALDYQIPGESQQNLTSAQMRATQGVDPASLNMFMQLMSRMSANQLTGFSDLGAGMGGVSNAYQAQIDPLMQLMAMDVQQRQANQEELMNQRGIMAGQKAQQWQLNVHEPGQQLFQLGMGLKTRGEDTWMAGMQQQNQDIESMMGMMMGQGGSGSDTAGSMFG